MGDRLAAFYDQAESFGGLEAKVKLALLTRVPSVRAQIEADSAENIASFESALATLRADADRRRTPASQAPFPGNEELLWGVLSSLHDAMVAVFDRKARCILAWDSRSLETRYGTGSVGVVRETIARQIAEQRAAELELLFDGSIASESELMVKIGEHDVWLSVTLSPVNDDDGEVMAVVAFAADVSERRRAARALAEQAERLRAHNRVFVELMSQRSALFSDPAAAFRRLTEAAAKTLDIARASIWFYDVEKAAITCVDLYEKERDQHSDGTVLAARDFPAYFRGLLEERTIAAEDAHTHPITREFSAAYLRPLGIGAMLDVPIWVDGEMVGVVCHEHVGAAREWSPDEESFAYLMGSVAALVRAAQGSESPAR